jgi:hypothetical protein
MPAQRILSTLCRQKRIARGIPALNAILARGENLRELEWGITCIISDSQNQEYVIFDKIGILFCLFSNFCEKTGLTVRFENPSP